MKSVCHKAICKGWLLGLILFFQTQPSFPHKCYLWNIQLLEEIRNSPQYAPLRLKIISQADQYMGCPLLDITKKDTTFVPNKHYYFSMPPYWWYDEKNGKYIRKDGVRNPQNSVYDSQKLVQLNRRLKYLSVSYFFTKDTKYLKAYVNQIRSWFIEERTKMYPNFEYAQVVPGQNDNKGRAVGLIDGYILNDVIESYRLTSDVYGKPLDIEQPFKSWFQDLAFWLMTSKSGIYIYQAVANSSIMYDVLLANISLFVDRRDIYKLITSTFKTRRLDVQVDSLGRQPAELTRTRAFSYSIFNLTHIVDFCIIQKSLGIHFYEENKECIDIAFHFLTQYIGKEEEWPYQQITSWEAEESNLKKQLWRMERVTQKAVAPNIDTHNDYNKMALEDILM